eukprot:3392159-Pyramimonas_sp.AAC.1
MGHTFAHFGIQRCSTDFAFSLVGESWQRAGSGGFKACSTTAAPTARLLRRFSVTYRMSDRRRCQTDSSVPTQFLGQQSFIA